MDRKSITARELAGMILLIVLLAAGLLISRILGRQQDILAKQLEDSAWMALSGQWSDARETAEEARRQWEKSWNLRAAFADHTPMEEVDDLFARLRISAAAGDRTEFARDCSALAGRIRAVGNAQRLSWQNVF